MNKAVNLFDEFWGSVSSPERVSRIVRNELSLSQEMAVERLGYELKVLSDYENHWLSDSRSINDIRRSYFIYMCECLSNFQEIQMLAFFIKCISEYMFIYFDLFNDCALCKYYIRRMNRILNNGAE